MDMNPENQRTDKDPDIQRLEMRIVELEDQLKQLRGPQRGVELSPDDIQAYHRVREALRADWGDFCGINDCMPCIIVRCIVDWPRPCIVVRCDVECICGPCYRGLGPGPCYPGGSGGFGGGRFGRLGD